MNEEVDQARVEFDLISSAVTVGSCFVVWRSFETDHATIRLAAGRHEGHVQNDVKKLNLDSAAINVAQNKK